MLLVRRRAVRSLGRAHRFADASVLVSHAAVVLPALLVAPALPAGRGAGRLFYFALRLGIPGLLCSALARARRACACVLTGGVSRAPDA